MNVADDITVSMRSNFVFCHNRAINVSPDALDSREMRILIDSCLPPPTSRYAINIERERSALIICLGAARK